MADIKYEIIEQLGVLSESEKGWKKELNLIFQTFLNRIDHCTYSEVSVFFR